MDMRMPVMDGYEATQRIRNHELNSQSHIPIIAVTSSAFDEERANILAAGCNDFIRKPFREAEIFDVLRNHLGVRYVYQEESKAAELQGSKGTSNLQNLTSELNNLPPDLLVTLEQAAAQLDMEMMTRVIEAIRSHNASAADGVTTLANEFKYKEILSVIRNLREKSHA
jgi:CheY-like chemotaxis protein